MEPLSPIRRDRVDPSVADWLKPALAEHLQRLPPLALPSLPPFLPPSPSSLPPVMPHYRRLLLALQAAILDGRLAVGTRLPSSRSLAADLGIARNTVIQAYEQLLAEGYVQATPGSGTYVADTRPARPEPRSGAGFALRADPVDPQDSVDPVEPYASASPPVAPRARLRQSGNKAHARQTIEPTPVPRRSDLSERGQRTLAMAAASPHQSGAFMPGVPEVSAFPLQTWRRLQNRVWKHARHDWMTYATGGGHPTLRHAIANYLRLARADACTMDQIIITTGIHQSVDLCIRLLCDVGDEVWIEDPGYWGLRTLVLSSGLKPVPIPVDAEGMNPGAHHLARPPRLILCTPSHQYPLGEVMSLQRRRFLLDYAQRHQCWIIEDDYDSEFRYGIGPQASLRGLDADGRVLYVSSFSKVLFPGMRVGYLVVPETLAKPFATGLTELYREGQLMTQACLAEFIAEGHLASHIRRMRSLYAQRRLALLAAIERHCGPGFGVVGASAGLHLVLTLPSHYDDQALARAAQAQGVTVRPLSLYYSDRTHARPGLVLGYACVDEERIHTAFDILADVMGVHGSFPSV